MNKKAKTFLFALAATMTLFVACGKDNEDDGSNQLNIADNTVVYNGVTYIGESPIVSVNGNLATFSLEGEKIRVDGDVEIPSGSTTTIDLSQQPPITLAFHLGIGDNEETILDLRYDNRPEYNIFWCFLDGDNMSNESAFQSGTATFTETDGQITIMVNGVLKNGKSLSYRIVGNSNENQ